MDISRIQKSVDGVSSQVSGVSQKVAEINVKQQAVIKTVDDIKQKMSR